MVEQGYWVGGVRKAKTVVVANNFAEGADFVEGGSLRAHLQPGEISLWLGRIRPKQKTTDSSIWECRGSSTRGPCARGRWNSPRRLYSWSRWRRPVDLQESCRA